MSKPIHIISLGAGVQSSTMALMATHGEITPMPKCAIFADTQDEPQSVYVWLDWLEKQLPFPVHRVTAGRLSEYVLKLRPRKDGNGLNSWGGVPAFTVDSGMLPRQCTRDFKVVPLEREIRRIGGRAMVTSWIGISLDEVHRMKPSRGKTIMNRWPLIEKRISRHDCLRWMNEHSYPVPPRSACVFCPYHSDREWRRLRDDEPEAFKSAVEFERSFRDTKSKTHTSKRLPFLHRLLVPLDQVDFSTDEDHGQQVMFGNECEGMCGV